MSDAKLQKLIKLSKLKCEQYDNDTPMKIIFDIMNMSNKSQNVKIIIKTIEKETSIKQHIYNNWPVSKEKIQSSNGNASETKANGSFDSGVFFDIEAKRTALIVRKLFSKRSEHVR